MFDPKEMEDDQAFKDFLSSTIEKATGGLTAKVGQLTQSLSEAKKLAEGALPAEELAQLKANADKAAKYETDQLEAKGEWETLAKKAREKHDADMELMAGNLEKQTATVKKLLVDGQLATSLAETGVNPALLSAAQKLLADEIVVVEDGEGNLIARVGDQTIQEYVKDWAGGDVGKHFAMAPNNSGGGGKPNGEGSAPDSAESFFDPNSAGFNKTKQYELMKSDPDMYKQLTGKFAGVKATSVQPSNGPQPSFRQIQRPAGI